MEKNNQSRTIWEVFLRAVLHHVVIYTFFLLKDLVKDQILLGLQPVYKFVKSNMWSCLLCKPPMNEEAVKRGCCF